MKKYDIDFNSVSQHLNTKKGFHLIYEIMTDRICNFIMALSIIDAMRYNHIEVLKFELNKLKDMYNKEERDHIIGFYNNNINN